MTRPQTLQAMVQESLAADSPINKLRRILSDDEKLALEHLLRSASGCRPFVEPASELSSLETVLLLTALRQSQKIERLEILLQRLTVRVLELYATQDPIPEHSP